MGDEKLNTTLKAAALIGLVENGVIQREENGDIDTENFERFWCYFERQMDTVIYDRLSAERQKARREGRQRRENRWKTILRCYTALFFLLGVLLAALIQT